MNKNLILKYTTLELMKLCIFLSYVIFGICLFQMVFVLNQFVVEKLLYMIFSLIVINAFYYLKDYTKEKLYVG